jgi:hypothetical protein
MIEIGHKRLRVVKTLVKDGITGKKKLVPKFENEQPVTELVANEPVRVTRGVLNGHFCRDSGRKLVVKLCDGDVLKLRPQGCRKGAFTATVFDIYSWMIKSQADQVKMAKLRTIKSKKEDARRLRALHRPIKD